MSFDTDQIIHAKVYGVRSMEYSERNTEYKYIQYSVLRTKLRLRVPDRCPYTHDSLLYGVQNTVVSNNA